MVPQHFERDHARVMVGSRTALCVIHAPAAGKPTFRPELGYSTVPGAPKLYEGTARVQAILGEARSRIVGEQDQRTAVYQLAIDDDAVRIPAGSVVTFTQATDAWLAGDQLFVRDGDLGSIRFERHLACVDDITAAGEGS